MQTGELGSGKGNDYGMVADGHGFEDSPDCERISGGVNSKGPYALAIGRQANLLHWGFYAAPDRMTDSARKVFRNALVYMQRFDGQRPLVQKQTQARGWFVQYIDTIAQLDDMDEKARESFRKYITARFPKDVIAAHGLDRKKLRAWYDANVEYIRSPKRYELVVDDDLKGLGLSNRKPEFLDWLVARLTKDADDALARRLAERYLGEHGRDAATALAWIRDNRERLFFSDQGGFRWLVDSNPPVER